MHMLTSVAALALVHGGLEHRQTRFEIGGNLAAGCIISTTLSMESWHEPKAFDAPASESARVGDDEVDVPSDQLKTALPT